MSAQPGKDRWTGGDDYEAYVGRWSRGIAVEFVDWLGAAAGLSWLDLGCGTGALSTAILERAAPASVVGIDPSPSFIDHARAATPDRHAVFLTGDALALPLAAGSADVVVSGLVLNFIPDTATALRECVRVARPGATVAAYVWDYAEGMEPIRAFWDAAIALDPAAGDLDEAVRFPLCRPDALREAFGAAGLVGVVDRTVDRTRALRDLRRLLDALPERHGACARLLRRAARRGARGPARPARRTAAARSRRVDPDDDPRLRGARHHARIARSPGAPRAPSARAPAIPGRPRRRRGTAPRCSHSGRRRAPGR